MLNFEKGFSVAFKSHTLLQPKSTLSCLLPRLVSYSPSQIPQHEHPQITNSPLLKSNFKGHTLSPSELLNVYSKSGRIADAEKLFDEMPKKNVVLCTKMIHGYAKNGFHRESLKLFSQMQVSGLVPNSFTMVAVLVSTAGFQCPKLGASVHGRIFKNGLEKDSFVGTAMLDAYAKCGSINDSYKLFGQMDNPSLISFNAMIAGFVHNELFEEALLLFKKVWRSGLMPNAVTILSVVRGCTAIESSRLCESIHGFVVKARLDSNLPVINSILDMYLSFENLEVANEFFGKMDSKDVISWTAMIGFLVRFEFSSDALKLFHQMRANSISLDMVAVINVITACGLLGDLMRGRSLHHWVIVSGFGSEIPVVNSLIAMYSKCWDLDSARIAFNHMVERSLISWTAMITGYVQNGKSREALGLLMKMRIEEDFTIDSIVLMNLLSACGKLACLDLCKQFHAYILQAGFLLFKSIQNNLVAIYAKCGDVELAHNVFEEMDCHDIVAWNAIIYGYGINGQGQAAVALFHDMEKRGEAPDSVTYLSVLNACSHSGLVDDGLDIFKQMLEEKKIRSRGEHWGCVVDMLARAGRLEDASKFVTNTVSQEVGLNVWRALLGGCRIHNNVQLAELVADQVFQLDPEDSGQVVLLSNLYASVGRFQEAENLRSKMRRNSYVKSPGLSYIKVMPSDFG
ncbi:pentatricopeptide repeat-containing protein, chloroplastic [Cinnamomum micranthum f. kanehirae]|uniref:Pentatricopeptide repeat-containing protein, chloroplastic n=1 Tax=Cinnamomum micranthum f. kanehirae TaxID=337451 RepID=A0A3S4PM78_9MAGN|nr:pentatricopeptide repeat-containing protein, chloroplastic [Cinnamomum micranthum f. kanehirae]